MSPPKHPYVTDKVLEEGAEGVGEEERGGVDLLDHFLGGGSVVRGLAGAELVGQNSQTPQIRLEGMGREQMDAIVVGASLGDLRGDVVGRSADGVAHFVADVHRPPEVADLGLQLELRRRWRPTSSPMRMFSVLMSRWITWFSCMYWMPFAIRATYQAALRSVNLPSLFSSFWRSP